MDWQSQQRVLEGAGAVTRRAQQTGSTVTSRCLTLLPLDFRTGLSAEFQVCQAFERFKMGGATSVFLHSSAAGCCGDFLLQCLIAKNVRQ